jgi:hypothetical protein
VSSPVSEVLSELHHLPAEEVAHLRKLAHLRGPSLRLPPPLRRSPTRASQPATEAGIELPLVVDEVAHPHEIACLWGPHRDARDEDAIHLLWGVLDLPWGVLDDLVKRTAGDALSRAMAQSS